MKNKINCISESVWSLAVLPNGDLASGSWDNSIKILDSSTWELKRTLTGHTSHVYSQAVMQNGYLASESVDPTTFTGHRRAFYLIAALQNEKFLT